MLCKSPKNIVGDPVRIGQVLTNLIGNAIKFTDVGEVVVSVQKRKELHNQVEIYFEVKDTGIGVPEETREYLFRPFTQADGSMTRKYGGTGLGLAISKQLVEIMGGKIAVESVSQNGSKFWFTGLFEKQRNLKVSTPSPKAVNLLGAKVLIVNDNATIRKVLLEYVSEW